MSLEKSKKVTIMWRLFTDAFQQANKDQFIDKAYPRKIGSSISAVNNLLVNGDELKTLMPIILGVDPKSNSSNWDKLVKNYWDSLSVDVYSNGLDLEIGFKYDMTDKSRKEDIANLQKDNKDITNEESLAEFVEGNKKDGTPNVKDNEKWKYAAPLNNQDWLLYRYCVGVDGKGYRRVSNSMSTIEHSPVIDFYIYDESIANKARKKTYETQHNALIKYVEIVSKRDVVDDLLLVFGQTIVGKDDMDKDMALDAIVRSRPAEFLQYSADANLKIKARIEKYINANVLKRLPGTSLIVDYNQSDVIIGNNMAEAVTFFSPDNTATKAAVSEYSLKYKASNTKK